MKVSIFIIILIAVSMFIIRYRNSNPEVSPEKKHIQDNHVKKDTVKKTYNYYIQ